MIASRVFVSTVIIWASVGLAAGDEPASEKAADQRFDRLLTAAKKAPDKADWKALRAAFAETSRYQPYNIEWRKELTKVANDLKAGDTMAAEGALSKLMEREGYMRLDAHGLAIALYEKTGQKEKLALHRKFTEGLSSTIFVPGTGESLEKPIDVLFIEEEYLFLSALGLKPKRQGLKRHDEHRFDVFTTEPKDGAASRTYYFNIDLPQKALEKMFRRPERPPGTS
jgi:hypothetical protein